MKDEIKAIINQHLFPKTGCAHQQVAPPGKLEAIAEAIAALPKKSPGWARVQAILDEWGSIPLATGCADNLVWLDSKIQAWFGGLQEAVNELVERPPVDRVQAMALFVRDAGGGRYAVPDTEMKMYTVDVTRQGAFCHLTKNFTLCSRGNCDHALAVDVYRARRQ